MQREIEASELLIAAQGRAVGRRQRRAGRTEAHIGAETERGGAQRRHGQSGVRVHTQVARDVEAAVDVAVGERRVGGGIGEIVGQAASHVGVDGAARPIRVEGEAGLRYEEGGALLRARNQFRIGGPADVLLDVGLKFERTEADPKRIERPVDAGRVSRRRRRQGGDGRRRGLAALRPAALIEPLGALVGPKGGKPGLRRLGLRLFLGLVGGRPVRLIRRFLPRLRPGGIGRISPPEAEIARVLRARGAGEEKRGDPDRRACAPRVPRGTEKARGHRRS